MYRKRLLTALLVVAFVASMTTPALADDSDTTEYSVLYHGNFEADDAHRFSYRLYYLGADGTWNGATQWSATGDERDVNHWDYTNGYPGVDPYPGANARDIMYTSGHGWPNLMRMYQPRYVGDPTREKDLSAVPLPDNIGPDKGLVVDGETVRWEIGVDSTGVNRTISRWDDDLEWAFLASCNQLSSTGDSRRNYARTLLGDPNRAHAVWGYDAVAPGDVVDVNIVNDFFDYAGDATSIRYAWLKANDNNSQSNAAGIVHASTQYEGLPPVCALDPDSVVGSTPDIHFWYIPEWEYVQQSVSQGDTPLDDVRDFAATLFGVEEAHAGTPNVFVGATTTYTLRTELPELRELPVLKAGDSTPTFGASGYAGILGGGVKRGQETPDATHETIRGEKGTLRTWPSGAQGVLFSGESTSPVSMSRSQAVEAATEFVGLNGGMPEDAELTQVRAFASRPMSVQDGALGSETISEYIVDFHRFYDGVEIDGVNGDGISVVVDSAGTREYRRSWRSIQGNQGGNGSRARVTAAQALQVLAEEGGRHLDTPAQADITGVDLVYYSMGPEHSQSAMFPAWRITLDDSAAFYVNAVTGRAMNE